jgi:DNA-directed RNA polymerase subunit N (RpoN/RPB10)
MLPVRCYSCNYIISAKQNQYEKKILEGKTPKEALDELKIKRYCCRSLILTYVNLIDKLIEYNEIIDNENKKINKNNK